MAQQKNKVATLSHSKHAISGKRREWFLGHLVKGYGAEELALHLAGKRNRNYRRILGQIHRTVATDEEFQMAVALAAKGQMLLALPGITEALIKRAKRGRPDAIKLIYEASGFHNPRMQHEHTGEIDLRIVQVPRPTPVDNEIRPRQLDQPIVDADVVEED